MRPTAARWCAAGLAVCALGAGIGVGDVSAQDAGSLASLCTSSGTAGTGPCAEAAVAARALLGHVGLLAGLGSEVPGSPGALGLRLGTSPRPALSIRAGVAHVALPDHTGTSRPAPKTSFLVPTVHAGFALGVFDGFFLRPTAGGFLSLDLMVQASFVFLPSGSGFEDRVGAVSYGARLGILRESFTLPGIAISASRRNVGDIALGSVTQGDLFQLALDPTVTSIRATVGKDLLAVGLLAGMGWDSYGGSVTIRADDSAATLNDFSESRFLYFAGASLNFLVLQVSAEGGMARGFSPVAGYSGTSFDPGGATWFGSVAFRLTL